MKRSIHTGHSTILSWMILKVVLFLSLVSFLVLLLLSLFLSRRSALLNTTCSSEVSIWNHFQTFEILSSSILFDCHPTHTNTHTTVFESFIHAQQTDEHKLRNIRQYVHQTFICIPEVLRITSIYSKYVLDFDCRTKTYSKVHGGILSSTEMFRAQNMCFRMAKHII